MTTATSGSSRLLRYAARALAATVAIGCTPTAPGPVTITFNGVCLHPDCTPDPGWPLEDCAAAEAGLEFFSPAVMDFEQMSNGNYVGQYLYGYTDGTASTSATSGYQPPAIAGDRCQGVTGNHIFHLYGGPFLGWGGGIGVAMEHFAQDSGLCPQMLNAVAHDYCFPFTPDSTGDALSLATMDFRQWEGVALWARRGPDSQPLLRVLVGDKFTDDDISFLMYGDDISPYHTNTPRFCERVRECDCTFQDAPCTYSSTGDPATNSPPGYYCGAPGATPSYANMAPANTSMTGYSNKCNTSMCDDIYPAYQMIDPEFHGRPCTPYTTRNGVPGAFCFDPATDPPPASGDQQCGDHFTFPLHLTTEWQLYLIPFDTMYQQGWAKKAPYFDLQTISVVRLTWDGGYIDYYIDDLKFYRHKQQ